VPSLEESLTFIETGVFTASWQRLRLTDDDLSALQSSIMSRPKGQPVIQGTGGLRKIRFAAQGQSRGKSGGFRACYVYFDEFGVVLLVVVYPKNEKDNISAAHKKAIRQLISRSIEGLARRPSLE
jgi:hypothetical protein